MEETVADPASEGRGIEVDDAGLAGTWVAVDLERLPFVPLRRSRLKLPWRYQAAVGGHLDMIRVASEPSLPPPAETPAEGAAAASAAEAEEKNSPAAAEATARTATIPPDRIVRIGNGSVAPPRPGVEDERARRWAHAARQRQQELDRGLPAGGAEADKGEAGGASSGTSGPGR